MEFIREMVSVKGKNARRILNPRRHEHEIYLKKDLPRYKCKGCKQFGANKGYECQICAAILHIECAIGDDEKSHNGEVFKFRRWTKGSHSCDACGNFIKGFLFQASSRALMHHTPRFHPLCMVLPETFSYSGHRQHRLELRRETGSEYTCDGCQKAYTGWRYKCPGIKCGVILDLNCCIIDYHKLIGITKVQAPSVRRRIMGAVPGFLRAVGPGVLGAAATVASGAVVGARDVPAADGQEEEDEDQEPEDDDDEES